MFINVIKGHRKSHDVFALFHPVFLLVYILAEKGEGNETSRRFTICRIEGRSRVWVWRSCYGYREPVGSTARDVNTGREFPEPSNGSG